MSSWFSRKPRHREIELLAISLHRGSQTQGRAGSRTYPTWTL